MIFWSGFSESLFSLWWPSGDENDFQDSDWNQCSSAGWERKQLLEDLNLRSKGHKSSKINQPQRSFGKRSYWLSHPYRLPERSRKEANFPYPKWINTDIFCMKSVERLKWFENIFRLLILWFCSAPFFTMWIELVKIWWSGKSALRQFSSQWKFMSKWSTESVCGHTVVLFWR